MNNFLKYLLILQIAFGLFTIGISAFVMLPNVHIVHEQPADFSTIVGALNGASPTHQQIQRAASILSNQQKLLESTTQTIEIDSKAFIYNGLVLVVFGVLLLFDYFRRSKSQPATDENKK